MTENYQNDNTMVGKIIDFPSFWRKNENATNYLFYNIKRAYGWPKMHEESMQNWTKIWIGKRRMKITKRTSEWHHIWYQNQSEIIKILEIVMSKIDAEIGCQKKRTRGKNGCENSRQSRTRLEIPGLGEARGLPACLLVGKHAWLPAASCKEFYRNS